MPYNLPDAAQIAATDFRLNRVVASNPSRGGDYQTVELAEPLWAAQLSTAKLTPTQSGAYAALFAKTRGGSRTVYVWDAERTRPIAYAYAADIAFGRIGLTTRRVGVTTLRAGRSVGGWGSPWVRGVNRVASTIDTFGWTPGAQITPGDYIAFDDGPARRLHMVVEPAVADATGNALLTVEPPPPTRIRSVVPVETVTDKPAMEAVLSDMGKPATVDGLTSASFVARQVIRRF